MAGMHVLLFVDCTKDFKRSSMIVKKISKELFDHGHEVTILDTEAFEYLLARQLGEVPYQDENNNSIEKELTFPEIVAAEACVETCDAMLFISPKSVPVLPKCMGNLLKNQKSAVLNRWHLLGVSCFLIAKPIRKASMAQFLWKMLRKFESNSLHNVLEPWRRYEWSTKSVAQETPLPSV